MSKLVLLEAEGKTREIKLNRERITIGRRSDNDVCLPYPAVSSEHAVVLTVLSDSFLEDLDSTNGTLVNGRPIAAHLLRDRDRIEIGRL
jgi:pSer/pThr/pTyr-binding forkhead associated (FHA) protein